MAINKNQKYNKGASIIEILVVIFIIAVAITGLLGLINFSLKTSILIKNTTKASEMAQETIEAVRSFRDNTIWDTDGLGTLTDGFNYHPEKSGSLPTVWTLVSGEEIINGFTRKVVFDLGHRDINDNIVESGGTADSNTKKVVVTVSWDSKEVEINTYLTNWK